MKNKRVLLTVVMMLFSLFIYSRPAHTYAAMSVDATVKEAVSASKNLYWSWSVAGRGDGKVQPYAEYNQTKLKLANAKKAVSSLPKSKQAAYKKSLDEVQLQIDRAAVYIDIITRGKKVEEKRIALEKLVQRGLLTDETEKKFHELSYEIKKQAAMFDKVYGKTTRDAIRKYYKEKAEKVRNDLIYPITVKMTLDDMELELSSSSDTNKLTSEILQVVLYLDRVPQSSFRSQLENRHSKIISEIPDSLMTGKLQEAIEINSDFRELDRLVSPGKSAAKVPVLYDRLGTRFKSFTSKESELQSKLDKIMSDLNVPIKTVKNMLTAKSKAKGIPPEITKAIALQENAGLVQFLPNGEVFSSDDQGYGIMQVTRSAVQESQFDWDQVKYDLSANIDNGLDILMEKWDSTGRVLPAVNTHNKSVLEDWYFAIMAYNGIGQRNNPTNINAYQMKVYSYVINNAINNDLLNPEIPKDIKFAVDPQTGIMSFKEKMSYETSKQTYSGQLFNTGDKVTLKGTPNLRPEPNTSKPAEKLPANTKISIVEAGIEDNLKVNLFNWYKVKVEGSNKIGYIASNNFIQQIISDAAIRK